MGWDMAAVYEGVNTEHLPEPFIRNGADWRVVQVVGQAYFVPIPTEHGMACILNTESARHHIASRVFTHNARRALLAVGRNELCADASLVGVTVWCVVYQSGDVVAKCVNLTAEKGTGHVSYALNDCPETESLMAELAEELADEAKRL